MLIGEYPAKLAEKNRTALPKKFRDEMEGQLFMTRGYEGCLIVVDQNKWDKLIQAIEVKPFLNRSVRDTKRFIAGGASELVLDSQGRFVLSEFHQSYADIEKDMVFVGILDWVELWSLKKWNEKVKELSASAGEIAERLVG